MAVHDGLAFFAIRCEHNPKERNSPKIERNTVTKIKDVEHCGQEFQNHSMGITKML